MTTVKPQITNDLQFLRQLNSHSQRQKLITGIFDRRLRQLAKLESKQQILSQCQRILIQKVLDYMNQLDAADIKYLQQTEAYSQRIMAKEDLISKLQKSLDTTKNELRFKVEEIEKVVKEMGGLKLKITHLESENEGLLIEQKKDEEILQNNKKEIKQHQESNFELDNRNSILEEENVYLNQQLEEKVHEINQLNKKMKSEGLKNWNQSNDKEYELEQIKRKMNKQIANKDKQITVLRKKVDSIELTQSSFAEALSSMKNKGLSSFKLQDIILNQQKRIRVPSHLSNLAVPTAPESKDASMNTRFMQSHHFESIKGSKADVLQPSKPMKQFMKNLAIPINCQNTPPLIKNSPMKRSLKQDKMTYKQDDEKDKISWKAQVKKEFVNTFSQLYKLSIDLKKLANQRIVLALTEKTEVEQILAERPSREEDISKIRYLMEENQQLAVKLKQSQQRAQSAYQAMRICKLELKRRIDNTPLEISNSPQSRLHQKPSSNPNSHHHNQRPDTPTVRRESSMIKANSNSSLTVKRKFKRVTDNSKGEDSMADCIRQIIGGNNLNLNRYVKRSNSSFSLTREERRRDLKSALP